jgi:DNA polymerase-3 subunit gamma/tau
LSTAAFNALLKTLEEPPPHAIFVLATTESHKIPATVLSRCQRFEFRRIPLAQIIDRLEQLLAHEDAEAEPAALNLIARQATGALRDAESLLDQLLSTQSGMITLKYAQDVLGTASNEKVGQMVAAWIAGDAAGGLSAIQYVVEVGTDPQQFALQVVDYLRGMLFLKTGGTIPVDIPENMHDMLKSQANALQVPELVAGIKRFSTAVAESKGGWQPQLPLELAFVECVSAKQLPSVAQGVKESPPVAVQPAAPSRAKADHALGKAGRPTYSREAVPATPEPPVAQQLPGEPLPAGSLSLSLVQKRWGQVRASLKRGKHYSVEALLNSGQLLGVEGETVILGFEHGFHREKMGADNNREAVEEALAEVMETPLRVRCVDPRDYQPPAPAVVDPEEIKRFAVDELDAQIVDTAS